MKRTVCAIGLAIWLGLMAGGATADEPSLSLAKAVRKDEAPTLKAHPDVARRTGDVLTISFHGKAVASFNDLWKDCEGYETCSLWAFDGLISLTPAPGKRETYVVVMHEQGEGRQYGLISRSGDITWLDDYPVASPDGRYVVIGEAEGEGDGFLSVIDWTSAGHRSSADFAQTACDPGKWQGTTLKLVCSDESVKSYFALADLRQSAVDTFTLRETSAADSQTRAPIHDPAFHQKEVSARIMAPAPQTAKEKADDDAYYINAGYKRLTP